MSEQYVLTTSGGSPVTNFQVQQWLELLEEEEEEEEEASVSTQSAGGMYDLRGPQTLRHRRRSTALVNTSDYLHPYTAPSTDGSTTSTTSTTNNRVKVSYDAMISPFPDLKALQKEGLGLALARGADDAFIKGKLGMNAEELTDWVEWENQKAEYEYLKWLEVKDKKKMKKNVRARARKVAPLSLSQQELDCAVVLVSKIGGEYNKNPGKWAMETMAENELMLAGGAKRIGTLLRDQKQNDDAVLREKIGKLVVAVKGDEKDEQAKKETSLVLTGLKASPGNSGKHKKAKTNVRLKKGDARLWQH